MNKHLRRASLVLLTMAMCLSLLPSVALGAAPPAPKSFKGTALSTTSIKLTWKKTAKAKSYIVYKKSGSKYVKAATTSKTTYTVKKLKAGTKYSFKIAVKTAKGTSKQSPAITVKTKAKSTPAPTGKENTTAKNALIKGANWTWGYASVGIVMYGFFGDGTYNSYLLAKAGNFATTAYTKGSYRVVGDSIYLTNIKYAGASGWDRQVTAWSYTDGMDEARIKLQNVPMTPKPDKVVKYEFDKGVLRMIDGASDMKFLKSANFSGPFPTHKLPGIAWPSAMMPPGTPAYTDGAIGRRFDAGQDEYKNAEWEIHHTTPAALLSYVEVLKARGWNVFDGIGDNAFEAQKGGYRLALYIDKYGTLQFKSFYVDRAGAFPANLFPAELPLPDGGFPAERVDASYLSWDTGSTSISFTLDGVDAAAVERYVSKLVSNGWALDPYDGARIYTKTIFHMGKNRVFEIWIYDTEQNLTDFTVWIKDAE